VFRYFCILLLFFSQVLLAEADKPSTPAVYSASTPAPTTTYAFLDPTKLQLASVNAMVVDVDTDEILYQRNPDAIVPIASLTKLLNALVVLDDLAQSPLDEWIAVDISQTSEMQNVFSHLRIGSQLQRRDMLLLALMSSENRAAATLAHHYSSGYAGFIKAMNAKAQALGMTNSHFVEPTGLSPNNVSTPRDLAHMLKVAASNPLISAMGTTSKKDMNFRKPRYSRAYYNTNPLVNSDNWNIVASKTGFINEAGRCLLMQVEIQHHHLAIVLLDSFGKRSPIGDAGRVRRWIETGNGGQVSPVALEYVKRKQKVLAVGSDAG